MTRHACAGPIAVLAAGAALLLLAPIQGLAEAPGPLAALGQDPVCQPAGQMPLEGRASPYDSVAVQLPEAAVKICYGRPSARGRTMIGGEAVPFGELWRTGANEPTTLHTTGPLEVGGIRIEAGSYSLYTRPGEESWELFLNSSTDRWGIPINDEVRASEVGSATLPRERPPEHVETLTLRFVDASDAGADLVLEWEEFRVTIPVRPG